MPEVELTVEILGKTWIFHGFGAIVDLAHWMDSHASVIQGPEMPSEQPEEGMAAPATAARAA